jgi:hypothetical protein
MDTVLEFLKVIASDPAVVKLLAGAVVTALGSIIALIALPPGVGLLVRKLIDAAAYAVVRHLEQKHRGASVPAADKLNNDELKAKGVELVKAELPLPVKLLPKIEKKIEVRIDSAVKEMNLARDAAKLRKEISSVLGG